MASPRHEKLISVGSDEREREKIDALPDGNSPATQRKKGRIRKRESERKEVEKRLKLKRKRGQKDSKQLV